MTDPLPVPRIEWYPVHKQKLRERVLQVLYERMTRKDDIVYWTDETLDGQEVIVIAPSYLYD